MQAVADAPGRLEIDIAGATVLSIAAVAVRFTVAQRGSGLPAVQRLVRGAAGGSSQRSVRLAGRVRMVGQVGVVGASVTVLDLAERDYLYGSGSLRLRLEQIDVSGLMQYDGDDWYPVRGVRLTRSGADLRRVWLLVRRRCIPAAPSE